MTFDKVFKQLEESWETEYLKKKKKDKHAQKHPTDISYDEALDYIDKYEIEMDSETVMNIKRLEYCERFNIRPFEEVSYEEQPKMWLWFIEIYDYCKNAVINYNKAMGQNG